MHPQTVQAETDLAFEDVVLSWSGGKDSAMALFSLKQDPSLRVPYLLTTVTDDYQRVTVHGVRRSLLHQQVAAVGAELIEVMIPASCRHDEYASLMEQAITSPPLTAIHIHAFADLYLQDVRDYREGNLAKLKKTGLFPVWGRNTHDLAEEFLALGFRAKIVSLDPALLDADFAGQEFDQMFLEEIPEGVDPCGENGEFHTFVYDGPIFQQPVPIAIGQTVMRRGHVYTDLVPA
jgi:uncharacterized protein (TIGR00290 family)